MLHLQYLRLVFSIKISQGSDVMYKNVKENRYTNKTETYGKLFLIKDTL